MKKEQIAEEIKKIIMRDLLVDVNVQKCVIDVFLQDPKEFEKISNSFDKASINFLDKCKNQLQNESDRGNILFFRKYNYEKILNEYLAKTYGVDDPEMELFPSEKKLKELEEKRIQEQQRQAREEKLKRAKEKSRKARENREKEILSHISNLSWKRIFSLKQIVFATEYNGKPVELDYRTHVLSYNHIPFNCVEYDGQAIADAIEKTQPLRVHSDTTIVTWKPEKLASIKKPNPEELKKKQQEKAEKKKRRQEEEERKKREKEEQRKQQEEENRKIRAEKKRLKRERVKAEKEAKRLRDLEKQEHIRQMEEQQQANLRQLPQIGTKDFVVRRFVFRCMHSQHKVVDLTAAVTIVNDDGKEKLVKVTAGYCQECNVYFIMESTYIKLRTMGVVLCRICDEKTYMANSYMGRMKLARESILMQFGYTVSQEEGLSATKRQKILAVIIDNKILTKSEVISYLDFFIRQRQYQSKYEIAISKWEADRDFVREYKIGEYTQFGVNAIYRKHYYN